MDFRKKSIFRLLCLLLIVSIITFGFFTNTFSNYPARSSSFDSGEFYEDEEGLLNEATKPDLLDLKPVDLRFNNPKISRLHLNQVEKKPSNYQGHPGPKAPDLDLSDAAARKDAFDTVDLLPRDLLIDGQVPAEVFYLWCGKGRGAGTEGRWFEFKHYLSVVSVLRSVRPDNIYLYVDEHPPDDRVFYNQWLDDLKFDYPWFHVINMSTPLERQFCQSANKEAKLDAIFRLLDKTGGIYISEETWLLDFGKDLRSLDLFLSLKSDPVKMGGYLVMRAGMYSGKLNMGENYEGRAGEFLRKYEAQRVGLLNRTSSFERILPQTHRSSCFRPQHIFTIKSLNWDGRKRKRKYKLNITDHDSMCLTLDEKPYDQFYPMDIWELNDAFGRLARWLFYGTEEIRRPKPDYSTLVPNIGHMIWNGGGAMDYVFYLSLLSMLFVAKVDTVYVHGDKEPAGPLWKQIRSLPQTKDRVTFVTRMQPSSIYQGFIEPYYIALMSDLIRVDIMIKYGGIYTDTDAIWVRPLGLEDRGFDAVASYDWIDWSWPFQDTVNFGISYGKKDAIFWKIFRNSMRRLHNHNHGFTGVMMPYKLLEKYPHLLRIDRRLSVICYLSKCHPTWYPNYHNQDQDHTNTNSIPNWRKDVHAFHWTHPNPRELFNKETLLNATGIFAELGRNVLIEAGIL